MAAMDRIDLSYERMAEMADEIDTYGDAANRCDKCGDIDYNSRYDDLTGDLLCDWCYRETLKTDGRENNDE